MNSDCAETDDGSLALAFLSLRFLSASQILFSSNWEAPHRGTYEHTKTTFLMEIANLFQQRICVPFFIFSFRRLFFFLHFYTQLKKCVCVFLMPVPNTKFFLSKFYVTLMINHRFESQNFAFPFPLFRLVLSIMLSHSKT